MQIDISIIYWNQSTLFCFYLWVLLNSFICLLCHYVSPTFNGNYWRMFESHFQFNKAQNCCFFLSQVKKRKSIIWMYYVILYNSMCISHRHNVRKRCIEKICLSIGPENYHYYAQQHQIYSLWHFVTDIFW